MIDSLRKCVSALIPIILLSGCVTEYSAKPITAWVVDAQTKRPIPGVAVVAYWELEGGLEGGEELGEVMVKDAVTDANGRFTIPGWGPKAIPRGLSSNARLKDLDPELVLFKTGYEYLAHENAESIVKKTSLRTSDYDGKTIELKPFKGDLRAYSFHLTFLDIQLYPLGEHDCSWMRIPLMLRALREQS